MRLWVVGSGSFTKDLEPTTHPLFPKQKTNKTTKPPSSSSIITPFPPRIYTIRK